MWSGCILQLSLLFCNVLVTSISPFPLVGSQLFARGMNLDWPIRAQSGTWSSRVSNSRGRRTWFTCVCFAVWSNISQAFYNKKWSCDHLEVLYEGKFTWLYGNMIFTFRCSPSWRELVRWEQLSDWSKLADLPLRSKGGTTPTGNRLKRSRIVLKLRTRRNDNLTLR